MRSLRCDPFVKPGEPIFLFGDSLAVGLDPFMRKLAAEKGLGYGSASKGGTTMRYWLGQATSLRAAMANARAVFISLGTNDTYSNMTAEDFRRDVEAILALSSENGRRVMWILPPKLPKEDRASPVIRETKVEVFESSKIDIPMGPDKIHPTGAGYAMWAGLIWRNASCGESQSQSIGAIPNLPAPRPVWMKPVPAGCIMCSVPRRRRRRV